MIKDVSADDANSPKSAISGSRDELDPRAQRSRAALGEALLDLMEHKSLNDISIRELTDKAGVGYATFFRNFESLDQVLTDIASSEIEVFLAKAVPMLAGDNRVEAARQLCAYVESRRAIWTTLLTRSGGSALRQHFLERALASMKGPDPDPSGLPLSLRIHFGVRGTVDIIAWWLLREQEYTQAQVVSYLERLVIDPL